MVGNTRQRVASETLTAAESDMTSKRICFATWSRKDIRMKHVLRDVAKERPRYQ